MFAHFVLSYWFRLCYLVLYWHNFNLCFFLKVIYKIEKPFACIKWIFTSLYFLPVRNRIWEQILGTQSRGTIKLKRVYPIKHTSPQIQIWLTGKYVSKQERNTSTFVLRFWWELTLSWLTGRIEMPFLSRRASFVQIQRVLLLGRVMQFCRSTTDKSSSGDLIPTIIWYNIHYTLLLIVATHTW